MDALLDAMKRTYDAMMDGSPTPESRVLAPTCSLRQLEQVPAVEKAKPEGGFERGDAKVAKAIADARRDLQVDPGRGRPGGHGRRPAPARRGAGRGRGRPGPQRGDPQGIEQGRGDATFATETPSKT